MLVLSAVGWNTACTMSLKYPHNAATSIHAEGFEQRPCHPPSLQLDASHIAAAQLIIHLFDDRPNCGTNF